MLGGTLLARPASAARSTLHPLSVLVKHRARSLRFLHLHARRSHQPCLPGQSEYEPTSPEPTLPHISFSSCHGGHPGLQPLSAHPVASRLAATVLKAPALLHGLRTPKGIAPTACPNSCRDSQGRCLSTCRTTPRLDTLEQATRRLTTARSHPPLGLRPDLGPSARREYEQPPSNVLAPMRCSRPQVL